MLFPGGRYLPRAEHVVPSEPDPEQDEQKQRFCKRPLYEQQLQSPAEIRLQHVAVSYQTRHAYD